MRIFMNNDLVQMSLITQQRKANATFKYRTALKKKYVIYANFSTIYDAKVSPA